MFFYELKWPYIFKRFCIYRLQSIEYFLAYIMARSVILIHIVAEGTIFERDKIKDTTIHVHCAAQYLLQLELFVLKQLAAIHHFSLAF